MNVVQDRSDIPIDLLDQDVKKKVGQKVACRPHTNQIPRQKGVFPRRISKRGSSIDPGASHEGVAGPTRPWQLSHGPVGAICRVKVDIWCYPLADLSCCWSGPWQVMTRGRLRIGRRRSQK